ncbi:kinesin protein [Salix suchowensis]|nr:kinesin protein [Salix suchowensis]
MNRYIHIFLGFDCEECRLSEICLPPSSASPTSLTRRFLWCSYFEHGRNIPEADGSIVDDRILTFDPNEKDQAKAFVERGFVPPGTKRYKDRRFMFDKVFGHSTSQSDVYGATAQPLLKGLLDGYNATVFAYGATGCGKTHTISGTDADPGIIYLTMADLFQRIDDRSEDWNVEVMVTFLEIYNEEIRDLLAEPGSVAPKGGLNIREDKTVKVVGLTELRPRTADEVKSIVLQGNLRRTQSPTHANETSSRSHAVLQVHVMQSPRTPGLSEQRTVATLSIIDLAGSERAAATMNMGQRMVEGANINKSLLALGTLTRLLKFSLGGNCKTVMIVCVAPTSNHFDDTHNTLIYAERATKIKTKVVTRNVVNVDRHVGRYVEAINRLNNEIAELKAKLAGKRDKEKEVQERRKAEAQAKWRGRRATCRPRSNRVRRPLRKVLPVQGRYLVSNEKKPTKPTKNVQWKDEAGQGELDDRTNLCLSELRTAARCLGCLYLSAISAQQTSASRAQTYLAMNSTSRPPTPVIKLTEQVETKTMEEDEEVLFKMYVKSPSGSPSMTVLTPSLNPTSIAIYAIRIGVPNCSVLTAGRQSGRKEERVMFVSWLIKRPRRSDS